MFYNILHPIGQLLRIKEIDIYNSVFKLHCKITVVILIGFSLLVCATQYFGTPIDCITDSKHESTIEKYCWIKGTYISKEFSGMFYSMIKSYKLSYNWFL